MSTGGGASLEMIENDGHLPESILFLISKGDVKMRKKILVEK